MSLEIVLTIGVLLVLVGVVYLIERRTKTRGPLFSGKSTPLLRVLALILGVLFSGFFLYELFFAETIHCLFPILGVALLLYFFGAGKLLRKVQGVKDTDEDIIQTDL